MSVIALLGVMLFFGAVLFLSSVAFSRLPQTSGSLEQPISFSHKTDAGDFKGQPLRTPALLGAAVFGTAANP